MTINTVHLEIFMLLLILCYFLYNNKYEIKSGTKYSFRNDSDNKNTFIKINPVVSEIIVSKFLKDFRHTL